MSQKYIKGNWFHYIGQTSSVMLQEYKSEKWPSLLLYCSKPAISSDLVPFKVPDAHKVWLLVLNLNVLIKREDDIIAMKIVFFFILLDWIHLDTYVTKYNKLFECHAVYLTQRVYMFVAFTLGYCHLSLHYAKNRLCNKISLAFCHHSKTGMQKAYPILLSRIQASYLSLTPHWWQPEDLPVQTVRVWIK